MSQLSTTKRVVFTTWGSFGDLHPFMALALELQQRGYVSVIATSPIYREKVKAEGLGFYPVRPDIPPLDAETSADIIRRVSHARRGPSYLFRQLLVPHLRETYADTLAAVTADGGADLLVSHQVPLTAPLVAEKTGIKWISSVLFPIAFASAHDPPTPPQLPALRTIAATHPSLRERFSDSASGLRDPGSSQFNNCERNWAYRAVKTQSLKANILLRSCLRCSRKC